MMEVFLKQLSRYWHAPRSFFKSVFQSTFGYCMSATHLVLFCYVIFEKPAENSPSMFGMPAHFAGVNYIAGRQFHFTYESILFQAVTLLDLPGYWLAIFFDLLVWPFLHLPLANKLHLSEWQGSWLAFFILLISSSFYWQFMGYVIETYFKHARLQRSHSQ